MGTSRGPEHDIEQRPRHYHDNPDVASPESSSSLSGEQRDVIHNQTRDVDLSGPQTWQPRWLREALVRVPAPIKRASGAVVGWVKGPRPPRIYKIEPIFPAVQTFPLQLVDRYLPKSRHRVAALLLFYILWLTAFAAVLHHSAFADEIAGYGSPSRVTCLSRYWASGNDCGLNGDQCRPFDNSTFAFRCPANCKRTQILNPYAVGAQEINYRPLLIGGPGEDQPPLGAYRGDSFICSAAIHAGVVNDEEGGCAVLALIGERRSYPSSDRHGLSSIAFDSSFPMSFTFVEGTASQCKDLRWPLLAVSVTFSSMLSLFTTSPAVFFFSTFVALFFHTSLASDPPNLTDYYSIVSVALGRFLPAAFCAFVVFRHCTVYQLTGLRAQVEKTVLWLGACWVGALNNYTFDKIPIQRLTPHDIQQQPGAVVTLVVIVLVIFAIALGQAWALRLEARMPRYLALYSSFGLGLLLLLAVPGMNLRIHHYVLALLLLPGTALQNRPSLIYQGLLVGLFINGVARWGFDSILQTPAALRGDANRGTPLPPIQDPLRAPANITFSWPAPPPPYDGVSVLVNDVERLRAYRDPDHLPSFTWTRHRHGEPEYFRFAYMSGSAVADYTKAGVWHPDGRWTRMESGPS